MSIFKRLYITWLTQKVAFVVWKSPYMSRDSMCYEPWIYIGVTVDKILNKYTDYEKDKPEEDVK